MPKYNPKTVKLLLDEQNKSYDRFHEINQYLETKATAMIGFSGIILSILAYRGAADALAFFFIVMSVIFSLASIINKEQDLPGMEDFQNIKKRCKIDEKKEALEMLEVYRKHKR